MAEEVQPPADFLPVYVPSSAIQPFLGRSPQAGPLVAAAAGGQSAILKELGSAIFEWIVGKTLDEAVEGAGALPAGWRSDGNDEIVYEGNYYILGIIPATIIPVIGLDPYAPTVKLVEIQEVRCCDEEEMYKGVYFRLILAAGDLGFRNVRRSGVTSFEVHAHAVRDGRRLSMSLEERPLAPDLQEQTKTGVIVLPAVEICIPCEFIADNLITLSFTVRDEDRNVRIKRQTLPLPSTVRDCCNAPD